MNTKNKKLKRASLVSLIGGYLLAVMFVVLMLVGVKKPVIVEKPEKTAVDKPVVEVEPSVVKQEVIHDISPRVDYVDRLNGIIIDDPDNVYTAVVNGTDTINNIDEPNVYIGSGDRGGNRSVVGHDVTHGHVEGGTGHVVGNGRVDVDRRNRDRRVDGSSDDVITFEDATRDSSVVDPGLLDRRIRELETDKIGLDTKDEIDLGRLTLVDNQSEGELGDIADFDVSSDGGYGVGKGGQLYAYNFPSQGVGAGVGVSSLGAAGGGSAGLGAGIGEAVLNGESVPTLGGVGTYNSVQTVSPGTGTDTDKDGLTTADELALGTDPTKSDSDGDGYADGAEIEAYTDPKNASSNPSIPGSPGPAGMGGVGGLTGGALAGGAAGLTTGQVTLPMGVGTGGAPGGGYGRGKSYNYDHLPEKGSLHIMMHVDGSGSILNTRKQLDIMKDTILKQALLPYYNDDASLYDKRVTIVDGSGERTLKFFTEASKKKNVLALVFQDEAQPAYHLPNFNKKPEDSYVDDMGSLKSALNKHTGVYRGVMFQVDRGKVFAKSFKEFVENTFQGKGYLSGNNLKKYHWQDNTSNIQRKQGIVFSDEYHAKDSGDPQYYLDLIFAASKKIGLDLESRGAGLTDGTQDSKSD